MSAPSQLVCIIDVGASIRKGLTRLFRSEGVVAEAFESAGAYLEKMGGASVAELVQVAQNARHAPPGGS